MPKFRALTSDNKIIEVKEILFLGDETYIVNKEFPIEEGKLLQWTGLKDKKGIEIYQGDNATHISYGATDYFKVIYFRGTFRLQRALDHGNRLMLESQYKNIEIVNPSLLK